MCDSLAAVIPIVNVGIMPSILGPGILNSDIEYSIQVLCKMRKSFLRRDSC